MLHANLAQESLTIALAAEFFALGLDPYPRKPGVAFEQPPEPESEATPFATLKDRKPD